MTMAPSSYDPPRSSWSQGAVSLLVPVTLPAAPLVSPSMASAPAPSEAVEDCVTVAPWARLTRARAWHAPSDVEGTSGNELAVHVVVAATTMDEDHEPPLPKRSSAGPLTLHCSPAPAQWSQFPWPAWSTWSSARCSAPVPLACTFTYRTW